LTIATYRFLENPIRHWKLSSRQMVGFGLGLVVVTITVLSIVITVQR
jgi:hypothetical protein